MSGFIFPAGLQGILAAQLPLGSVSVSCLLLNSSFQPDRRNINLYQVSDISSYEISGTGYSRKSVGTLGAVINDIFDRVDITIPGNIQWTGSSGWTARYAVLYETSSTKLIALLDLGSNRSPSSSLTLAYTSNIIGYIQPRISPSTIGHNYWYTRGLYRIVTGVLNLNNPSNGLKAMLLKSSYSTINNIDKDDLSTFTASEASGTGYVAGYGNSGRKSLTGQSLTINLATARSEHRFDPLIWNNVVNIGDIQYLVLISEAGGSDATSFPIAITSFNKIKDFASSKGDIYFNCHDAGFSNFFDINIA